MKPAVDKTIHDLLDNKLLEIEKKFNSDVFTFYGAIEDGYETQIRNIIEELASKDKKDKILVILTTNGGSAIAVERYVNILRHHYKEVNFIVPDYAYSAGTIFCMSGDNIYMDYSSVLGPIDPQVKNKQGNFVAALGYLDKVNELIAKAKADEITQAEFLILKDFDLAELKGYEQAKELTISLLKNWLVKFKFKNWNTHAITAALIGTNVTPAQKETRAKEVADQLSNYTIWKTHSRPINMDTLRNVIKLKIEDFGSEADTAVLIHSYQDLITDYVNRNNVPIFVHTKTYI